MIHMNEREKETYAMLEAGRYNALFKAKHFVLESLNDALGSDNAYDRLSRKFGTLDDMVDSLDVDEKTRNLIYALSMSYDYLLDCANDIEMSMYVLNDGRPFDADAEHIDADMIEADITIDQSEEFEKFVDGLSDYDGKL